MDLSLTCGHSQASPWTLKHEVFITLGLWELHAILRRITGTLPIPIQKSPLNLKGN